MMKHGDMHGASGMRAMMNMMHRCMKMMDSMGMKADMMSMMHGMSGDSAAPSRGQGMQHRPMKMDGDTADDTDGDSVPEES